MTTAMTDLIRRVKEHLAFIYPDLDHESLARELIALMGIDEQCRSPQAHRNNWDESDTVVITYGDSIVKPGERPLITLKQFLDQHLQHTISSVHILPFFPYSSDDGFSVID